MARPLDALPITAPEVMEIRPEEVRTHFVHTFIRAYMHACVYARHVYTPYTCMHTSIHACIYLPARASMRCDDDDDEISRMMYMLDDGGCVCGLYFFTSEHAHYIRKLLNNINNVQACVHMKPVCLYIDIHTYIYSHIAIDIFAPTMHAYMSTTQYS